MKKARKAIATAPVFEPKDYGWSGSSYEPQPSTCKQCRAPIPPARRRGSAFGGYGRPREFCGATCRKKWSRAHPSR